MLGIKFRNLMACYAVCAGIFHSEASHSQSAPGQYLRLLPPSYMRASPEFRNAANDGWVVMDMHDGAMITFDNYKLTDGSNFIGNQRSITVMEGIKNSKSYRELLNDDELYILDHIELNSIESDLNFAEAKMNGERYEVGISNGYHFTIANYSGIFSKHSRDFGELQKEISIMYASEIDRILGRSRWYWPESYDYYLAARDVSFSHNLEVEDFAVLEITRAVLLHEICHHYAGDTIPSKVLALKALLETDKAKAEKENQRDELRADRCAATAISALGGNPAVAISLLLSVSILQPNRPDHWHPSVPERLLQIDDLNEKWLTEQARDGMPMIEVEKLRSAAAQIRGAQVDYKKISSLLDSLPRGSWPTCPFEVRFCRR